MANNGSNLSQKVQMPRSQAASSYWIDGCRPKRGYRYLRCCSSCAATVPVKNNPATAIRSPCCFQFRTTVSSLIHHLSKMGLCSVQTLTQTYRAGAAGTVRAVYQGLAMEGGLDKPWLGYTAFAAGIAECNIAIICACAPSLKSFLGGFFRDNFPTSGSIGSSGMNMTGFSDLTGSEALKRSKADKNMADPLVEVKNSFGDDTEPRRWPTEYH
jgi:hypothetical protein